ncbi:hypothetical protein HFC64_16380 [Saccharolobus solfataricus]|uniref:Uncharacterized protein n=1 Tax=Saccharolobus solfataricus TaxID=2287 RepID=A0A7S9IL48_SACSO|nr:hypothetical protein [Saccharolobus solfataricus]QPG51187.1 hypothetical protein HFC64_16380 [Saccharolobus solfataricus]
MYFTNYGKNIIVQTILTIYNCPAVTVHREPPPQILLHSYNKITLSSVTVYINGNLIPSVSSILFFNSAVVFNLTNNNYITYNGNLTSGKIVSGIILHNTTPYYNYYNIKGVEQPMISNGNVIINDKYYSIPIGGYVVGVIGDHVVLYKNGEIYVINVKAISG